MKNSTRLSSAAQKRILFRAHLFVHLLEQGKAEKNAKLIVDQLRMAGDNPTALLLLDREMGARTPEAQGSADAT